MIFIRLVLVLGLLPLWGFAQEGTQSVEEMVFNETLDNAVTTRDPKMIDLEHYEVPFSLLQNHINLNRLPKEAKQALFFTQGSQVYVRWLKNPEDQKWHQELEEWLASVGVSAKTHKYFKGYQTASRSYIAVDPFSNYALSLKVSTDRTGGQWRDKKQTWADARDVRLVTDYLMAQLTNAEGEHLVFLDEPAAFGIEAIDQGMIVRMLNDLNLPESTPATQRRFYIPGFSVLHQQEGIRIAKLNGSSDPAAFWNTHYNQPLAKALAELFLLTGFVYDSPHSQNFMVEVDGNFKPTGRIVLKDLGDVYIVEDFHAAKGDLSLPRSFEEDNVVKGRIPMAVGLLHGNSPPSWMNETQYRLWGADFYKVFEKEISTRTGVPLKELATQPTSYSPFSYISKEYSVETPAWKSFWRQQRQPASLPPKELCLRILLAG